MKIVHQEIKTIKKEAGGPSHKREEPPAHILTSSMRHPKQKFYLGGSKSDLIARCFSVRKSVFVK